MSRDTMWIELKDARLVTKIQVGRFLGTIMASADPVWQASLRG